MTFSARLLDFDGSVTAQTRLRAAADFNVVDLRHLAPQLRYMSSAATMARLRAALPTPHAGLSFYGSGDFHHVSAALIAAWSTPLSVVVFDQHPDWDVTAPWWCCGSWVNRVLRLPQVRKVCVVGLGATDLHGWHALRGNLAAVQSGRLELYPVRWTHSRSLFGRRAVLPCATLERRGGHVEVRWQTLAELGVAGVAARLIDGLPTEQVYVSIDKDCLNTQAAWSNWESGELALHDLLALLDALAQRKRIVAMDVCGEYSQGPITNPLFRWLSQLDHPAQRVNDAAARLAVNESTNLTLLNAATTALRGFV